MIKQLNAVNSLMHYLKQSFKNQSPVDPHIFLKTE